MGDPTRRPGLRHRLFARFMAAADDQSHEMYADAKQRLLEPLRGTVVELGPGTGVNLRFFDPEVSWIGIEPNAAMHPHILEKADALGRAVDLVGPTLAEAGLAPSSVDAVVSTLVLCSVPSVDETLAQIMALLRPGGVFVFLEHVIDRPWTLRRAVQRTVPCTPWRFFSDRCNPARDIGGSIRRAGFGRVEIEAYRQQGPGLIAAIIRPHIAGSAWRADA